jgi:glycosyltransferase involved in cell wall biosynthesis
MRILYLHLGEDWIRGSERCLLDLLDGLDRQRFDSAVWCTAATLATEVRARGIDCTHFELPESHVRSGLLGDAAVRESVGAAIERFRPEVVHVNTSSLLKSALPRCWARRIPTLVHLHIIPTDYARHWELLHQATIAVGPSRAAVAGLAEDGVPAHRLRVIYNGVSRAKVESMVERTRRYTGADALRAVTVGSLISRKGMDVVIRGVAELSRRGVPVVLRVLGDGPDAGELRRLAESEAPGVAIEFLGERQDVGVVLGDSDVFVSAARAEAFPLTLIEAAFAGLPVVASDIPPHQESIVVGSTGRLFRLDSPESLADLLGQLAAHPAELEALGENGRQRALREFLIDRYVREFATLYEGLAHEHRAPVWPHWPPSYWQWLRQAAAKRFGRGA